MPTKSGFLVLTAVLDIICVFALAVAAELSNKKTSRGGDSLSQRLFAFRHEAVDLALVLLVRVVVVLFCAFPLTQYFRRQKESVRRKAIEEKEAAAANGSGDDEKPTAATRETNGGAPSPRDASNGSCWDESRPLLADGRPTPIDKHPKAPSAGMINGHTVQEQPGNAHSSVSVPAHEHDTSSMHKHKRQEYPNEFVVERALARLRHKQDKIKIAAIATCFVAITASGVVTSVKCLYFDFSLSPLQELLMGLSVLWINLEIFLLRDVIRKATKHADAHIKELHHHPLCFTDNITCTKCDLCNVRIRQEGYDCFDCDFTICLVCFKKKTNLHGENLLTRSDKGVNEVEPPSNIHIILRAMKLLLPFKHLIAVLLLCLLGSQASRLILPNYQGKIIDAVIKRNQEEFWRFIKIYAAFSVSTLCLGSVKTYCMVIVMRHVQNHVRVSLFTSLVNRDIAFFDGATVGSLSSRLTNDTNAMISPLRILMNTVLANLIQLVGGLAVCFFINWSLALIALTVVGPILYITDVYAKYSRTLQRRTLDSVAEANSTANEAFTNIRTIRAMSTEEEEVSKYRSFMEDVLYKTKLDAIATAGTVFTSTFLDLGAMTLILAFGGNMAMQDPHRLSVGQLVTFQLYANMINNAYQGINSTLNQFTKSAGASERVLSMLDAKPDISNYTGSEPAQLGGDMKLENVSFAYPMRPNKYVLRDANIHFPKNRVTAVVGKSGSGKSTICTHLLLRFYDPKNGRVLIDDQDLTSLSLPWYHARTAVVAQETQMFAGTIKDNITYGTDSNSVTHEDVVRAASLANALDFINGFEEGFDTTVGERGVRLSGGQRQRLAIARAFLRKPLILLLDEATSALDAESEAAVQDALDKLVSDMSSGCTIVIVAHRLSTVIKADNIIVVEDGTVAEQGTHGSLISRNGVYARLVARQLQGYNDATPMTPPSEGSANNTNTAQRVEQKE